MYKYVVDKIYTADELQKALDYRTAQGARLEQIVQYPLSDRQLETSPKYSAIANKESFSYPLFLLITGQLVEETKKEPKKKRGRKKKGEDDGRS